MDKYRWSSEDIYENIEQWEKDYKIAAADYDFSAFKGKLCVKSSFVECMNKLRNISRLIEKLSVYAYMKHDEDTRDSTYDALLSKIEMLGIKISTETAFITPELTSMDDAVLNAYVSDEDLKAHKYFLQCILKNKIHVLSESEERILSLSADAMSSFSDIFKKIDNADLPLGTFEYKGKKYPLTHGLYGMYLQNEDEQFRKKAFKAYYKAYTSLINTISATYIGNVKKDVFFAKVRKYDSALDKALSSEDVDVKVYETLIKAVNKNLPLLHRYMSEKKKALKVKKLHMYSLSVPIQVGADLKIEYDKAYDLVVKGLAVLGMDYQNLLLKAYEERWLDVYERAGKRSGAYSIAVYDTHPYVLLNYTKTTHDVFTIAHEMGHSIHSYFSNKNQPYETADYKIFVAEVASTVNEVLLIRYLIENEKDIKQKRYLLSYLLEMIRTTLFRQTQFAEFEEYAHKTLEEGTPLTKDNLTEKYYALNKKYYGRSVVSDKEIGYEWLRIPHFYTAFYVYKYATGIISALSIANRILVEGEKAREDYFKFLSSGGSDSPVKLLKIAGVDLLNKKTFDDAFKIFKQTLDEFASLNDNY